MKSDWFWGLVFVLFIVGTYIGEALDSQRKRMEKVEERLNRLKRNTQRNSN
jgi:preprotein translocase subunit YajC